MASKNRFLVNLFYITSFSLLHCAYADAANGFIHTNVVGKINCNNISIYLFIFFFLTLKIM